MPEDTVYPADVMDTASIIRLMRLKVRRNVDGYGFHIQGVFGSTKPPLWPFAYTVGLIEKHDHPELLIMGIDYVEGSVILDLAVKRIQAGERFVDGQRLARILKGGYFVQCRSVPADRAPYRLGVALAFYEREDLPVLQLVLPDAAGRFPDDPEVVEAWRDHQRVLW